MRGFVEDHASHAKVHAAAMHQIHAPGGMQVADEDGRVRGFVVERGPGLEVHPVEGKLSLRASPTGNIHLAAARGAVLPGSGGLKSALQCLTQAREVRPRQGRLCWCWWTAGPEQYRSCPCLLAAARQLRAQERAA